MHVRLPDARGRAGRLVRVRRGLRLRPGVHLPELPARGHWPAGGAVMDVLSMPFAVGLVLSAGIALFARSVGFDRDRAFYPTVVIVVALYYVLFAAMSGSVQTVVQESVLMSVFAVAAVLGFRRNAWIVVAALAGHGVFDALRGHVLENAGVPAWWPAFCAAYDLGAAAWLAWLLRRGLVPAGGRA
jgi:hypothetical protein